MPTPVRVQECVVPDGVTGTSLLPLVVLAILLLGAGTVLVRVRR